MLSVDSQAEIKTEKITNEMPRQQKMAVVFLAFISVSVVVIWALQLNAQINKPFRIPENKDKVAASAVDVNLIDSDGDGLSNTLEINSYKTSPYLEDSDSDGISDKQEIEQGTNPNCPIGQSCNSFESLPTTSASSSPEVTLNSDISDSSQVTPAILRQVLLQSGKVTQADLDKVSDEDLVAGYYEALKNAEASESASSTTNSQEPTSADIAQ